MFFKRRYCYVICDYYDNIAFVDKFQLYSSLKKAKKELKQLKKDTITNSGYYLEKVEIC